jgi:hypothetical protein
LARAQLRAGFPDLDDLVRRPAALTDQDQERLDDAFNAAHRELREIVLSGAAEFRAGFDTTDPDARTSPEDWRRALADARELLEITPLVDRLWPRGGCEVLAAIDYRGATLEDLTAVLKRWSSDNRAAIEGRPWSPEDVMTAISLWLSPLKAAKRPWTEAAERLLVDRAMSRAVRYSVIRTRAALSRGEER